MLKRNQSLEKINFAFETLVRCICNFFFLKKMTMHSEVRECAVAIHFKMHLIASFRSCWSISVNLHAPISFAMKHWIHFSERQGKKPTNNITNVITFMFVNQNKYAITIVNIFNNNANAHTKNYEFFSCHSTPMPPPIRNLWTWL